MSMLDNIFSPTLCLVTRSGGRSSVVPMYVAPAPMAERGKAKKSGELHSQPGKVVTERGGGGILHFGDQGNKGRL